MKEPRIWYSSTADTLFILYPDGTGEYYDISEKKWQLSTCSRLYPMGPHWEEL